MVESSLPSPLPVFHAGGRDHPSPQVFGNRSRPMTTRSCLLLFFWGANSFDRLLFVCLFVCFFFFLGGGANSFDRGDFFFLRVAAGNPNSESIRIAGGAAQLR